MKNQSPDSEAAVGLAKKLQDFITDHFYTYTDEILLGLGEMYAGGGDFTINIDKVGGAGTAEFADKAIRAYCGKIVEKLWKKIFQLLPSGSKVQK